MSRTFRRLEDWLIRQEVKSIEDVPEWYFNNYNTTDPVLAVTRRYYDFITGGFSYRYMAVPHWYRRVMGSKAWRLASQNEIRRCMNRGEWDDFLPPLDMNDTKGWW